MSTNSIQLHMYIWKLHKLNWDLGCVLSQQGGVMGGAIPPFRPHDLERNFRVALTQSARVMTVYYWDLDQITLVCQPVEYLDLFWRHDVWEKMLFWISS